MRTLEITQYFNRIPTGKIKIGGSRCRWHYIKMALRKIGFEVMGRIQLTKNRVQ
jgi:hypothetical protein